MAFTKLDSTKLSQWIKQNPGKKYRINGVEQVAPKSGVTQFLETISQPFRSVPAGIFGAITGREDNPFLTEEESQTFASNPATFGLKNTAGLLSYLVPGGAGAATSTLGKIGTAAARGAGAGALAGYGLSKEGEELSGIIKGSLSGGVVGGGLQGLSELLKPVTNVAKEGTKNNLLKEIGQNMETPVGRPSATKSGINTFGKSKGVAQTMEKTIKDNLPLIDEVNPTLAKRYRSGAISQTEKTILYEDIANTAAEKAGLMRDASTKTTDVMSLAKKIKSDETMTPTMKNALIKSGFFKDLEVVGKPSEIGTGTITNVARKGDLHDLLSNIDDNINYARSMSAPQPALEKALKIARKNISNEISTGLGSEYSKYNSIYSSFSRARDTGHLARITNDELGRTFGQGNAIEVPVIGDILNSQPVKVLQGQVKNKSGQILQQLADIGSGTALPQLRNQKASDVLSNIAKVSGPSAGAISGIPSATSSITPMQEQTESQNVNQTDTSGINLLLAQEVLKGNLSASEANAVLSLLGLSETTTKKTDLQRKAESALTSIDSLEGILSSGGNSVLINQLLPFQGGDSQAQMYNQAATNIMDTLARMRTGAVINEEEEKMYRGYIPKITDTPETKSYKLQQLRQIFSGMSDSSSTTF